MATTNNKENQLKKKEIELIILRLETLSPEVYFSSGNGENISRDEMIKHVRANDETGREFIETEMEFLRALKDGKLLKQIFSIQSPQIASSV